MKSSKHVETCFGRANNDFDDKLTAFLMKNNFWTKNPKNGHCGTDRSWLLAYKSQDNPLRQKRNISRKVA